MKRSEFARRAQELEFLCGPLDRPAIQLAEEAGVQWDPEEDPVPLLLHPGRDLGSLTPYGDRCRQEAAAANNALRRFLAGPEFETSPGNPARNAACVELLGLLAEERLKPIRP